MLHVNKYRATKYSNNGNRLHQIICHLEFLSVENSAKESVLNVPTAKFIKSVALYIHFTGTVFQISGIALQFVMHF